MQIRDATEDDISTIRSVARESWKRAYADAVPESVIDDAVSEWYAEETMTRIIGDDEQVCLVAVDESEAQSASEDASGERSEPRAGTVIGFSHGATDDELGDVLRLYVHPDRWHEGIGTALLETMEERLSEMGMEKLQAMVLADNEMGNAFYEEHGFEKTGEAETQLDGVTRTENVYAKAA